MSTTHRSIRTRADTATRLNDAEIALHIARQAGVDTWIKAAADRLHEAVEAHLQVVTRHTNAA